jgi:hypothetical protein
MTGQPAPPFLVGQRVRCAAHTFGRNLGLPGARTELFGRAGTVVAVAWREPPGLAGYWDVRVDYDHLGQLTDPTNPIRHRVEDLVPLESW